MPEELASGGADVDVLAALARRRIIPVAVVDDVGHAGPLAAGLIEGGLPVVEVTLRTAAALATLRALAEEPLLLGAGTVLSAAQVDQAVGVGARFVVSPGFSAEVVRRAQEHGVAVVPGAATATEIQMARNAGVRTVKFFPAESTGGPAALQAFSAVFSDMSFIPTGGIGPANLGRYLAIPAVSAVGGSWMLPSEAVAAGDAAAIAHHVAGAVRTAAEHGGRAAPATTPDGSRRRGPSGV